ncbi:MAG: HAD family hydrolase [Clostridia bacterium]
MGIKQEEMMAIGQSNDIEMLKAAGMSVAVGNAEEEVKEQASYISADNDNDGEAEAIEKSKNKERERSGN